MSRRAFDALPLYQTSMPTGVTHGRKWKRCFVEGWYMGEYEVLQVHPDHTVTYRTVWSEIIVKDGSQPEDGRYHFQKFDQNGREIPYRPIHN